MALNRIDLGLLALRGAVGGVLIAHGTQKLFGWFGGGGLDGTAKAMEAMGFHPARQSALAAGLGEAGGGALLVAGLATPAAGAVVAGTMAGAVAVHAPAGFFMTSGGYEYPAFLGAAGLALGLAGPGRYSLDHLTGHVFNRPWVGVLAFAGSAASAYGVVARRRHVVRLQEERAAVEAQEQEGAGLS
ncbi:MULTISPECIES: DoxX family protein [unclassified Streptomyces]|uniref:DoxX family protein n=1 Tax=Streptomycetaceae TaxID=2062 RepID=UPI002E76B885|nr:MULTISPECIES: DoxX family protein [unclassified Streptomyces]MED7953482.1 DoxX family protein [Streptomyces sp. BE303]MEE1823051.1 DoxX family protein [Streptomyces sp. BE20]